MFFEQALQDRCLFVVAATFDTTVRDGWILKRLPVWTERCSRLQHLKKEPSHA